MKLDKMTKQKIDEFFDSKTPEELEYLWKKYDKYSEENLTIPVVSKSVSRSNKENEDPIIGKITKTAFTTPNNHRILEIKIPYGYYKTEKWKRGDKVELVITD